MNYPAVPVDPAAQIQARLDSIETKLDTLTKAIVSTGDQVEWVVDNTKEIFAMFGNPAMMSTVLSMAGGMVSAGPDAGPADGPAAAAAVAGTVIE